MSKYFDGELLSAYEDLNKEFEFKKENVKLHEQIADLEAKLAESEEESKARYKDWQEEIRVCDELRVVLAGVRKQLEEKDKEIEKLNACVDFYKSYYISFNEKVIDELEKVKNYIITDEKDIFGANYLMKSGYVLEFIDNQIKELKGEKE